jgi:hypothetical protein
LLKYFLGVSKPPFVACLKMTVQLAFNLYHNYQWLNPL